MDRKSVEGGADELARGVAETIASRADRYLGVRVTEPLPFAPVALRLARVRRRSLTRRFVVASVGCAAAAVVVGFWAGTRVGHRPAEALTYTVDGHRPPTGGSLASAEGGEPVVSFSDGTRVQLAPHAHGRVVDVSRHGARIALDDGTANVEVVHRPGAQWFFEAGPFTIAVHGTAFTLGWDARNGRLQVQMRNGVVSVTGPVSGGEIFLRGGQTLSLSLHDDESLKAAIDPAAVAVEAGPAAPVASPGIGSGETSTHWGGRTSSRLNWPAMLADGQAAAIVADARRRGLAQVLSSSSSEDLAALADAARFERNDGLARRALLVQRQRFPGTGRAAEASFLLGGLTTGRTRARPGRWPGMTGISMRRPPARTSPRRSAER